MKLIDNYNLFLGTLTEVSKDKISGTSMIEDNCKSHRLINFDGVKKKICSKFRGEALASCDGMIVHDDIRYIIEFKNQSEGNVDKAQIRNKAFDSLALLALNENLTREEIAENTILIIVYNNEKHKVGNDSYSPSESIDRFTMKLKKLAKKQDWEQYPKKFDTTKYINHFYKQVYTIDLRVFMEVFYDSVLNS